PAVFSPSCAPRYLHSFPTRRSSDLHLIGVAVLVPGHHPGTLARGGGRQPLANQRVEQCGLAGLDPAGHRHPQRFVEPPGHLGQLRVVFGPLVHLGGGGEHRPGPLRQAHRAPPPAASAAASSASAWPRSWPTRSISASRSASRCRRSASVRWLASVAARSASLLDRLSCSARPV